MEGLWDCGRDCFGRSIVQRRLILLAAIVTIQAIPSLACLACGTLGRHRSARITMDVYAPAVTPARLQENVLAMLRHGQRRRSGEKVCVPGVSPRKNGVSSKSFILLVSHSYAVFYAGGQTPFGIAVADIDGDKILDIVIADVSGNQIVVLLGKGDGSFQSP